MNNKYFFSLLLSFFLFQNINHAQDQPSMITALNSYVHYTNESIHGMLIAHRLFENFNQEINKYVNLQSNQLNFYANKDLPQNIFVDPEQSFYKISPYRWYEVVKTESRSLKPADAKRLNALVDELKAIMDKVNQVRFDLENAIKTKDLTIKENQKPVSKKLESCVKLYEDFYKTKEKIRKDIFNIYGNNISRELTRASIPIQSLIAFQNSYLAFSRKLRYKTSDSSNDSFARLKKEGDAVLNAPIKHPFYNKAKQAVKKMLNQASGFTNEESFSIPYTLYGAHYYYHNVELAASFNSYGLGYICLLYTSPSPRD